MGANVKNRMKRNYRYSGNDLAKGPLGPWSIFSNFRKPAIYFMFIRVHFMENIK